MPSFMTLLVLLLSLMALPVAAQGGAAARQDAEVMNYRLSMEKLQKLVEVQRALIELNKKDPKLFEMIDQERAAMAKNGAPLTTAERAAMIDQNPEVKRVLTSKGTTAREWLLTAEAMADAWVAHEINKGELSPESGPPPVTAAQKANLALIENNQAEWQKIQAELERLTDDME